MCCITATDDAHGWLGNDHFDVISLCFDGAAAEYSVLLSELLLSELRKDGGWRMEGRWGTKTKDRALISL